MYSTVIVRSQPRLCSLCLSSSKNFALGAVGARVANTARFASSGSLSDTLMKIRCSGLPNHSLQTVPKKRPLCSPFFMTVLNKEDKTASISTMIHGYDPLLQDSSVCS